MRIKRLVLKNFGVYRGVNTFEFSSGKPVVLVGGMNGHGKTTFLNAVLLGLYGSNSPAYTESSFTTFGNYLRANTNNSEGETEGSVELLFEISTENGNDELRLLRSWDSSQQRIRDELRVSKNGFLDDYLTNNWPVYVEDILPRALSGFFFFDGEKIAELATENSGNGLKESIKALLGISIVELLKKDLAKLGKKIEGRTDSSATYSAFTELRDRKEELEASLSDIDSSINDHSESIEAMEKSLEMLRADFSTRGGQAIAERARLQENKRHLSESLLQNEATLRDICAGVAPLSLALPLLEAGYKRIESSQRTAVVKEALPALEEIASNTKLDERSEQLTIDSFMNRIRELSHSKEVQIGPDLSSTEIASLRSLLSTTIPSAKSACSECRETIEGTRLSLDGIEKSLAVEADQTELKKINIAIEKANECLIALKSEKRRLEIERSSINGEYITVAAQYRRSLKSTITELHGDENNERLTKYIALSMPVLDRFTKEMQQRKTEILGDCISECYRKLARKTSLVNRVLVDPDTLDLALFSDNGKKVPRISLSAGEKQLLVVSTLWALALCSKKKLPVIIDTPLARLDSSHRMSLVKTYFPAASDQTIILSTDSEIFGDYYKALKPNVSDEFTLVYHDDTKSTEVHRGYFIEGVGR